jgi:hypothetical protein
MFYNNETLNKYCLDNNIKLLEDYSQLKINRDNYIKGMCNTENCNEYIDKTFRQLVKTGPYCHNCAVENGKKQWNQKCKYNYSVLHQYCCENFITLINDYSTYIINRNTIISGKCITTDCDQVFNKSFRELIKLNGYCKMCCINNGKQKIKETNLIKFGVECSMQNNDVKLKQQHTLLQKYGVKHISQLDAIKEQKKKKSLEKYGTEYVLQSEIVKNKGKATNLLKYGFENPQQSQLIKDKTKETNIKLYGCKTASGNLEIKQKTIQTSLQKYGVPHHSQNAKVSETMLKSSYNLKHYSLPSGKIINYQGYENFALDKLLNEEHILEEDIITDRRDVPEIWYTDKTNKLRRHYVDFYIKSQNRCIEVKSTWTNQEKNNVFEKQSAAINIGYKYDIWIFNKDGNLITTY